MTHFKRVIEKNRKNMPSKFSVCGNLERDGWKQVCCEVLVVKSMYLAGKIA